MVFGGKIEDYDKDRVMWDCNTTQCDNCPCYNGKYKCPYEVLFNKLERVDKDGEIIRKKFKLEIAVYTEKKKTKKEEFAF